MKLETLQPDETYKLNSLVVNREELIRLLADAETLMLEGARLYNRFNNIISQGHTLKKGE